jgi:hypothetical protein
MQSCSIQTVGKYNINIQVVQLAFGIYSRFASSIVLITDVATSSSYILELEVESREIH